MSTSSMPATVYVGCGAGFSGDRFDAAVAVTQTLARRDGHGKSLSFLVLTLPVRVPARLALHAPAG